MNDKDRRLWVVNDEVLYLWWQSEVCGIYVFVRKRRKELTEYILKALGGRCQR